MGIVGRTGAGKSTLSVALSRLVELSSGQICINGVDIADLELSDLRSQITFITQECVLFAGTLRYNLDPLEQHTDHEIETVVFQAGLQFLQKSESPTAENSPRS